MNFKNYLLAFGLNLAALSGCTPNLQVEEKESIEDIINERKQDAGQEEVTPSLQCNSGEYICDENNKLYRCSGVNEPLFIADCGNGRCDNGLGACVPQGSDYTCYRQEVDFSPEEEFRITSSSYRNGTTVCPGDDESNQRPFFRGGTNIYVIFPVSQNTQVAAVTLFGRNYLSRGDVPLSVRLDDLRSFRFTAAKSNDCDPLMISTGDLKLPLSYESIALDERINVSVQLEGEGWYGANWGAYGLSKLVLTTCCYNRKSVEGGNEIDCRPPEIVPPPPPPPPNCEIGSFSCNENILRQCRDDHWVEIDNCGEKGECRVEERKCYRPLCDERSFSCDEKILRQCIGDQWIEADDCGVDGECRTEEGKCYQPVEVCETSCERYFYDGTVDQFMTDGGRACRPYCNLGHDGEVVLSVDDFILTNCNVPGNVSHFKMSLEGDGNSAGIGITFNHHGLGGLFLGNSYGTDHECEIEDVRIDNQDLDGNPLADNENIPIRLQLLNTRLHCNPIQGVLSPLDYGNGRILECDANYCNRSRLGLSRLELQSCHYEMRPKEE